MRRVLSLHLPAWSIDLVRLRHARDRAAAHDTGPIRAAACDRPLRAARGGEAPGVPPRPVGARLDEATLIVVTKAARTLVTRCCEVCAGRGVRAGMTLAEARALLAGHDPLVEHADPGGELDALEALGRWAMDFSPVVAVDPPDGLLLDVSGTAHLFGGERRLLDELVDAVEALGLRARGALAGTAGCAWALARHAPEPRVLVPDGGEAAALAPLPIDALRLDDDVRAGLRELGVERIAQLVPLARGQLVARFGSAIDARLRQALGELPEPLAPLAWSAPPEEERHFDGPVRDLETILLAVHGLLQRLAAQLAERRAGVWELDVALVSSDLPPVRRTVTLSRPSHDAAHLWSLLRPRLESAPIGFGIDRIALSAARTGTLHAQSALWEHGAGAGGRAAGGGARGHERTVRGDEPLGELLDRLCARLGPRAVLRPRAIPSHLPERAFQVDPFAFDPVDPARGEPAGTRAPRPSLLFPRPEPLRVEPAVPGVPHAFHWRGELHRVLDWRGPERIAPPWWEALPPRRLDEEPLPARRDDGPPLRRHGEGLPGQRRGGDDSRSGKDRGAHAGGGARSAQGAHAGGGHSRGDDGRRRGNDEAPHRRRDSSLHHRAPGPRENQTRDYFRLTTAAGRALWVFRELGTGRWFAHGEWA